MIRPDNHQHADFVAYERGYVCLKFADTITPAVRWYSLEEITRVNLVVGCAEPPPVTCTALAIWRPTVEVPITELGYYRPGSKSKAIEGVNLTMCNVRIVLTLPEAA